mmetsp:Transcript_5638/g.17988  ORF Transcript_5638/g.17988 Transcript_5638/m.17988 type:complete len:247 (+) Transcript_5638:324-1064(+)
MRQPQAPVVGMAPVLRRVQLLHGLQRAAHPVQHGSDRQVGHHSGGLRPLRWLHCCWLLLPPLQSGRGHGFPAHAFGLHHRVLPVASALLRRQANGLLPAITRPPTHHPSRPALPFAPPAPHGRGAGAHLRRRPGSARGAGRWGVGGRCRRRRWQLRGHGCCCHAQQRCARARVERAGGWGRRPWRRGASIWQLRPGGGLVGRGGRRHISQDALASWARAGRAWRAAAPCWQWWPRWWWQWWWWRWW